GTFVGDNQLSRAQAVEPGQRIRIGKTVLELKA
ncbi:FHA domain-containing protein, partial [Escherichia coli]|nr:FHA domain-containing protein [Escherichia coli]